MNNLTYMENLYSIGSCGVLLVTILVLVITQYKRIGDIFKRKKKKNESKDNQIDELKVLENEKKSHLADYYSSDHLEEIRRCIIKLHNFKPHEEFGAGEPAGFDEREQLRQHTFGLMKKSEVQNCINDNNGERMLANVPCIDDQDDMLMDDITTDDITISEDEEEEGGTHISPQAIADIEAELLDSSILNEIVEPEDPCTDVDEPEIVVKVMNEMIWSVCDSVATRMCMEALVEVILSDNKTELNKKEYVVVDGVETDEINLDIIEKSFETQCENSSRLQQEPYSKSLSDNNSNSFRISEEFQKCNFLYEENSNLNSERLFFESILHNASTRHSCSGHSVVNDKLVISKLKMKTDVSENFNQTSMLSSEEVSPVYSYATELVANYISRKLILDAVDECLNPLKSHNETPIHLDSKLNKISKIQTEKKKLTQEQLAEERRIQQNQLSDILALMEQNPHMFGSSTKETMNEQASLYCV